VLLITPLVRLHGAVLVPFSKPVSPSSWTGVPPPPLELLLELPPLLDEELELLLDPPELLLLLELLLELPPLLLDEELELLLDPPELLLLELLLELPPLLDEELELLPPTAARTSV
jgi:hypothetical protein